MMLQSSFFDSSKFFGAFLADSLKVIKSLTTRLFKSDANIADPTVKQTIGTITDTLWNIDIAAPINAIG